MMTRSYSEARFTYVEVNTEGTDSALAFVI